MFTRRVRITAFGVIAISTFAAAIAVATDEQVSTSVKLALIILSVLAGVEPLKIIWEWSVATRNEQTEEQLLHKLAGIVRRVWIDGVLEDALHDAQLDIPMAPSPEQVAQSGNYANYQPPESPLPASRQKGLMRFIRIVLRQEDETPEPVDNTPETVGRVFDNTGRKLLILGTPGSGKSVLLLQLAERLLGEINNQGKPYAVPIVFNLSSFAVKCQSLNEWLIEELQRPVYGVSKKLAWQWVNNTDKLIYLLDGLDEVAPAHRDACVAAINNFLTPERQVVICSRTEEYGAFADKLEMHYAIKMQPLSATDFESHLGKYIPVEATVNDIMNVLQADTKVWKEANKPLFLNVLVTTYHDGTPFHLPNSRGTALHQVQAAVLEPYITRQLRQAPATAPHNSTDTRKYLSWLGYQMRDHSQTTFYVEMLQADWLAIKQQRWFYRLFIGLMVGLTSGLMVGLIAGQISGLIVGLIGGLIYGLIYGLIEINLQQKLGLSIARLSYGLIRALILGLIGGLVGGLIGGLIVGLSLSLIVGLVVGLSLGLTVGLSDGLSRKSLVDDRSYVNQGLWDSFFFGLIEGLIDWLIFCLIVGLSLGLRLELIGGLIFLLSIVLNNILKHMILRCMLWRQEVAPRRFDRLLYHAKERRLMRQVGGGFVFIHRYFLDYFADYYRENYLDETT